MFIPQVAVKFDDVFVMGWGVVTNAISLTLRDVGPLRITSSAMEPSLTG